MNREQVHNAGRAIARPFVGWGAAVKRFPRGYVIVGLTIIGWAMLIALFIIAAQLFSLAGFLWQRPPV